MSYDVSSIPRITSAPLIQDPPHARVTSVLQNSLEGVTQGPGPVITSTMFSPDELVDVAFPPENLERVKYTYASFHKEQYASVPDEFSDRWELIVPIQIPSDYNIPKLLSLEYTLKYGSAHDRGNSTLQSDVILSTVSLPSGIRRLKLRDHKVYRDVDNAYGPRAVRKDVAWNLATSFGVKPKGSPEGWGHYIDHQRLKLGVRLTRPTGSTNLYFVLSAQEYPLSDMVRSVAVQVTAKWEDANPEANVHRTQREDHHVDVSQARPLSPASFLQDLRGTRVHSTASSIASREGPIIEVQRPESPQFFTTRPAATPPPPPPPPSPPPVLAPPVTHPAVDAPRPELSHHRRKGLVLYERVYYPPPACYELHEHRTHS